MLVGNAPRHHYGQSPFSAIMGLGKKFSHLLHEYDALDDAIVHVHVHFVVVARHFSERTAKTTDRATNSPR